MSQKLDNVKTGIKSLDDDLRELFAICEDKKKLNTIKQAIANKDISSEEFSKVVPKSLIAFSFFLSGPTFIFLLDDIKEEAVGLVKDAKSLIEKHFGKLFENQNAKSIFKKMTDEESEHEESLADETIRGIGYYLIWEDEPPELTPAARVVFKNRKKRILLNTRLDWEDFSFIMKKLSDIFVELLEKGKPLAELGQIDLSVSKEVVKNIEETLEILQKMKEIMPIYKAKTETDSNEQSVEASSN
jgi:hypothetical protein